MDEKELIRMFKIGVRLTEDRLGCRDVALNEELEKEALSYLPKHIWDKGLTDEDSLCSDIF